MPETVQTSLVADMDPDGLRRFVRRLDPDEVADVLWLVDEGTRESVLQGLDEDRRERTEFLLGFSPASAAGLMHLDYVTVGADRSLAEVARRVQRHEERTGRFPHVFVTDGEDLLGELPGQVLAMTEDGIDLREHVHETPAIRYDTPDEDVVDVFRANPESSVAVLDEDGSIMGVIYAEDLLRVVEEEAGEPSTSSPVSRRRRASSTARFRRSATGTSGSSSTSERPSWPRERSGSSRTPSRRSRSSRSTCRSSRGWAGTPVPSRWP